MSTPRGAVDGWRSRLAETETLLTSGSVRLRWLRSIYARVYRFLISRYGDEDQREDRQAAADGDRASATAPVMPFVDNRGITTGCEPKSTGRIRQTLDRLHAANEQNPTEGPLKAGLVDEAWIIVASESGHVSPVRCRRLLRREGIAARIVRRGDDRMVEVSLEDRDRAFALIQQNRPALKKKKGGVAGARNRILLTTPTGHQLARLMGAICGLAFGMAIAVLTYIVVGLAVAELTALPDIGSLAMIGGAFGAVVGWLFGTHYFHRT